MELELRSGLIVQLDEEDVPLLDGWNWFRGSERVGGYVRGARHVALHRLVMGAGPGDLIDHKNGDPLDCRRSNLRHADKSTNAANSRRSVPNRSGFRGVGVLQGKYFQANITVRGERRYLGSFPTAVDAAHAYDDAARGFFGEFASLNFPDAVAS